MGICFSRASIETPASAITQHLAHTRLSIGTAREKLGPISPLAVGLAAFQRSTVNVRPPLEWGTQQCQTYRYSRPYIQVVSATAAVHAGPSQSSKWAP